MKAFGFLAATLAILATGVVAQDECHDRCNDFYTNCVNAGGTPVFCGALRGTLPGPWVSDRRLYGG
jgi:hypothetical protein